MIDDPNTDSLRQVEKATARCGDVYRRIAAQKAGIPEDEVTPAMRESAKREAYIALYTPTTAGRADCSGLEDRVRQIAAERALTARKLEMACGAEKPAKHEGKPLRITHGVPASLKSLRSKAQWKQEMRSRYS